MPSQLDVWRGTPALSLESFGEIEQSAEFEVQGVVLRRPTRDDYATHFTRTGLLASPLDFAMSPSIVAEAQAHWHTSLANTCVFSAHLSGLRDIHGWRTTVFSGTRDPAILANAITEEVSAARTDMQNEMLSVVLPTLKETAEVARLVAELDRSLSWRVVEDGIEADDEFGDIVRVALRVQREVPRSARIWAVYDGPANSSDAIR